MTSMRRAGARLATLLLATLLSAPTTHAEGPSFEAESPEAGSYRLRGTGETSLGLEQALERLTAFDEHCAARCRLAISSLDEVVVVEAGDGTPAAPIFTWTRIDDTLDASYFQRAYWTLDGDTAELVIEIPEPEVVARLERDDRPHAPFFHRQRLVWRLDAAGDGATRVEASMTMASDRFLINLMPRRVLEGAEQTLREYFAHLAEVAGAVGDQPSGSASEPSEPSEPSASVD